MHSIRPFRPADTTACLALFDSNLPTFFAAHERADFSSYLQHPQRRHDYLVLERGGRIVACGGVTLDDPDTAAFCWGMVAQGLHRQGLGTALAMARIAQARARGVRRLVLNTSQHTAPFYAGLGFTETRTVRDGHGPGLDAVDMECKVALPGA